LEASCACAALAQLSISARATSAALKRNRFTLHLLS
jgi:hypothetical protein